VCDLIGLSVAKASKRLKKHAEALPQHDEYLRIQPSRHSIANLAISDLGSGI
jgi:hypothetical protein